MGRKEIARMFWVKESERNQLRIVWTLKPFGKKYPFGLQKLEAKGFRCFQVEVIYTEKMITLSNVSLTPGSAENLKNGRPSAQFWVGIFPRIHKGHRM